MYYIPVSSAFTVHFWVPTSNGTTPDTGVSTDSIRCVAANGTLFTADVQVSASSANAGQYYAKLPTSATSVVGALWGYYDQGAFPFPVFSAQVFEGSVSTFNASSTSVGLKAVTHSAATVGAGDIAPGNYSAVTVRVHPMTYSGLTVGIDNASGDVSSRFTVAAGAIKAGSYSAVTVRTDGIAAGTYSGVTVGINNASGDVSSRFTVGVSNIAPATYSGVTVGTSNPSAASSPAEIATAVWSVASGAYSALTVRVHPMTYSGLTVGVNDIAPGTYSGATVGGLNDVSNIPSSAFDFSTDTVIVGSMVSSALSQFFGSDSGMTYGDAVAGSVVKEIADNAGGASLTVGQIADGVWDEAMSGHRGAGSFGLVLQSPSAGSRTDGASTSVVTLGSGETTVDDVWNGALINFLYDDGTILAGVVDDYTGSDQSVSLRDPLAVAPSAATYWIVPLASSGNTVNSVLTTQNIAAKVHSGVTVAVNDIAGGNYSAVTVRTGGIAAGTYSGVTVGTNNIAAGSYSGVTIAGVTRVNSSVTIANADYSAVTVRPKPLAYSGLTVGVNDIAPATYSGVTVEAMNVSGVSTGPEIATEVWSTASGNLSALTVRVHPMDYSGLTVGTGRFKEGNWSGVTFETSNIAPGDYSAVTVRPAAINYSALTVRVGGIAPAVYSGVSFNVNVKQINDATLTGDGSTTSWGPA